MKLLFFLLNVIPLLHSNVVLIAKTKYDFIVNCSTFKEFFYKHLLQIYLHDLICTKIPKPQTVELGDSELFFFSAKLFIIARIVYNIAVFVLK